MANNYSYSSLEIDLTALAANYDILQKKAASAEVAAVVKSEAYGLGAAQVAKKLLEVGCKHFFVATLDEAIALRKIIKKSPIYVFQGLFVRQEKIFQKYSLIPVLNSMEQILLWKKFSAKQKLPCALHVDTGMNRLGLSYDYVIKNTAEIKNIISGLDIKYLMSHLACADEPENKMNGQQLKKMENLKEIFPKLKISLANSYGIFLDKKYHFDLVRPGMALYGINPQPNKKNPMKTVVSLRSKILQIRKIDSTQSVGYGATCKLSAGSVIATLPVGYADGYLRSLSNGAFCFIDGIKVPVVGRVSMDLITLDVTKIPEKNLFPGKEVEILGDNIKVDDLAEIAGTIGYEIFTALGSRYKRIYK